MVWGRKAYKIGPLVRKNGGSTLAVAVSVASVLFCLNTQVSKLTYVHPHPYGDKKEYIKPSQFYTSQQDKKGVCSSYKNVKDECT